MTSSRLGNNERLAVSAVLAIAVHLLIALLLGLVGPGDHPRLEYSGAVFVKLDPLPVAETTPPPRQPAPTTDVESAAPASPSVADTAADTAAGSRPTPRPLQSTYATPTDATPTGPSRASSLMPASDESAYTGSGSLWTDGQDFVPARASTVTAAEFLLSLLAPSRTYFRRVDLFAYVDAPAEISFERGYVVPHTPLDLHARSDFGNVLRRLNEDYDLVLGRNTVVLVLGDARTNRRPPRADLFYHLGRRVHSVVWLNPEDPVRWNTGDSVMAAYAPHVDLLLPASNPSSLSAALSRVVKKSIV